MEKLKKTLSIAVFERVCGDKGIGHIVKHDVLERLYGDKCVNYCVLKETFAKTCKHIKSHGIWWILWKKNVDSGATCCLDSFSGRGRCGYLKFPSLGSPDGREK